MARPRSHPAIALSYDPYSYYSCPDKDIPDRFIHKPCSAPRPASSYHSRPASIWSTSSICSDDSSLDLALDDRAHDFDDEQDDMETLASPISPAESSSSRTSWSSTSSSATASSSRSSPPESTRFSRSASVKPRGPRPLPALPISQPSSPSSTLSPLPNSLPLKSTPPLRLNLKLLSPPPSYEEAMSAGVQAPSSPLPLPEPRYEQRRPESYPGPFPFDATSDEGEATEFLSSPVEDTFIDWARIEEFIARSDG